MITLTITLETEADKEAVLDALLAASEEGEIEYPYEVKTERGD